MFTLTDDNTFVCDHCGVDYSECGCLGGEPDVFKVQVDNLKATLRGNNFELTPLDSWAHVDTSVDAHPCCLVCGMDLDDEEM